MISILKPVDLSKGRSIKNKLVILWANEVSCGLLILKFVYEPSSIYPSFPSVFLV